MFDIGKLSTQALSLSLDTLLNDLSKEFDYSKNSPINELLQFVSCNERSITSDEYEKLNSIVEKYCAIYNYVATWRQILVYIKENKIVG